jgi:NAD(P)-dependent dehydrogenase (short-subunit alcohol dehydrogenase family)
VSALLQDKVTVITGGASGIGEACVERFIDEGAYVFIVDRSGRQDEVAARLGARAFALKADVSDAADIERIFAHVDDRFGRLDVLMNNAGTSGNAEERAPLHQNSVSHIDDMLAINLRSAILCIKYGTPLMLKQRGGSIINTASVAAFRSHPGKVPYAAAKAGLIGVTQSSAAELGPLGIRVNTICPGPIDTPLLNAHLSHAAVTAIGDSTCLKRLGRPDEIASVAAFLASDSASYVTGVSILVDGGLLA